MELTLRLKTIEETQRLAQQVAAATKPGDMICLDGDLGAGKTTFSQAFAKALGITQVVNSPTFSIVNEYSYHAGMLYHFDFYRLENAEELFDIGFDEYVSKDAVVLIEWAEKFPELIPEPSLSVTITQTGEQERLFVFRGALLSKYMDAIKELA